MKAPKIIYLAPSYKRSQKSITQTAYPFVKLVVKESEAEEYRANGNEIIVCPDKVQGNVSRVRNWILDNFLGEYDCVVMLDDDISYIGRWEARQKVKFEPGDLEEFCEQHTIMCQDAGMYYWGLNCIGDKGAYQEYTPYGFLQFIGGPFQAHIKGTLIKYDETLPLKEDYDITLQHVMKYKGCMRVNFAFYEAKQSEQTGGCSAYRNIEREKEQFFLFQRKWGSSIVTRDMRSKKEFDYNPIIKTPIPGV